jgi:hypothetical protein
MAGFEPLTIENYRGAMRVETDARKKEMVGMRGERRHLAVV